MNRITNQIIVLILALALISCSPGNEVREYYDDGSLKFIGTIDEDSLLHGECTLFYKNGNPKAMETRNHHVLQGESKIYYENGILKGKVVFDKGEAVLNSIVKYYENGNILSSYDSIYPIKKVFFENGEIEELQLFNSADSLIDFVKYDQSGEVVYAPRNTAFIDFSASKIQLGEGFKIEVNRDHDKWPGALLVINTRRNNSILQRDTIISKYDDLGYYLFEYNPASKGTYAFDLLFLHPEETILDSIYTTQLLVN